MRYKFIPGRPPGNRRPDSSAFSIQAHSPLVKEQTHGENRKHHADAGYPGTSI
jgi:hypothetical protein